MPIYEYKCCDCCNDFEELVFAQDEKPACPKCGSKNVEKLMSAASVKTDGAGGGDMPDLGAMPPMGGGCGGGG